MEDTCEQCGKKTPGGGFCYDCAKYEEWLADQIPEKEDVE